MSQAPAELSEGFEGFDGEPLWLPEGWSRRSLIDVEDACWTVSAYTDDMMFLPSPTGKNYAGINFNTEEVDEWLVTAPVEVPASSVLTFNGFIDKFFLFNIDGDHFDFNEYEFIKKDPAANLQILVKEEGTEEWTVIKDFFEDYKEYTGMELAMMSPTSYEPYSASLSGFGGKTVRIAFRYCGTDGNTMLIDDVFVGQPPLSVDYIWPSGTLYYGTGPDFSGLNLSIAVEPVHTPLTWMNNTDYYGEDASYNWLFHSPETNDYDFFAGSELTATYKPDYTSAFTTRNNLYYTPELFGSAEGFSAGSKKYYDYFQAGGKAEWEAKDGEGNPYIAQIGMCAYDQNSEGMDIAVIEQDMEAGIPLYGYSKDVDKYWTDYTFGGDDDANNFVKMTGIFNYHFAPLAPMVIEGGWVLGKGQVKPGANFKLEIIPLTDEGYMADEPFATATCTGADINEIEGGMQNFIGIPFRFEEPLVLTPEMCDMYIVRFSGFNDAENVEFFAPYQSSSDNAFSMALGWIEKEITMDGTMRTSLTPTVNYTGYHTFAINLDAYYPWLEDMEEPVSKVSLGKDAVDMALSSYHHASAIKATLADGSDLPSWLSLEMDGRYGQTVARLQGVGEEKGECELLLSAPGVKKTVTVSYDGSNSAIDSVTDGQAEIVEIHTISGMRVADKENLAPGVYVVRYSDGTVRKEIVR